MSAAPTKSRLTSQTNAWPPWHDQIQHLLFHLDVGFWSYHGGHFYYDLWGLLQFSVIFTVCFHCVLLCGLSLCQVLKSSQTNRIANRLFGEIALFMPQTLHKIAVQCHSAVGIGSQFAAQIRFERRGLWRIFDSGQHTHRLAKMGKTFTKITRPCHLNCYDAFLQGVATRGNPGNIRRNVCTILLWICGLHHAAILFRHQITSNTVSFLQVRPVAAQQFLRPRHELTGTHLMKHRPIALAGRAAALIIGLLKLIPLQFDNGFNKICCIVTVYYI